MQMEIHESEADLLFHLLDLFIYSIFQFIKQHKRA